MSDFYDRDGKPLTLLEWAHKYEDREYRQVAEDNNGEVRVSTIWLGVDHNWSEGRPLYYETMIFGGPLDQTQWRWHTEKEAVAGHVEICSGALR